MLIGRVWFESSPLHKDCLTFGFLGFRGPLAAQVSGFFMPTKKPPTGKPQSKAANVAFRRVSSICQVCARTLPPVLFRTCGLAKSQQHGKGTKKADNFRYRPSPYRLAVASPVGLPSLKLKRPFGLHSFQAFKRRFIWSNLIATSNAPAFIRTFFSTNLAGKLHIYCFPNLSK